MLGEEEVGIFDVLRIGPHFGGKGELQMGSSEEGRARWRVAGRLDGWTGACLADPSSAGDLFIRAAL